MQRRARNKWKLTRENNGLVETTYSRDDMEKILAAHIQNLAQYFKGRCYAWDVVNEAIDENGVFRQSPSTSFHALLFQSQPYLILS